MDAVLAEPSAYRAGIAALAAGLPQDAVQPLRHAVAEGDGGAWAGLNLGLALAQLGRLAEAQPHLERATAALPDLAEPHFQLGTIAGLRQDPARATREFRAALARDPGHVPTLAALAALEEEAGRVEAAWTLLARARTLDPEEPELGIALARLAMVRGEAGDARDQAEAVLARRPAHVRAARLLADALLALHEPPAAKSYVQARAAAAPFAAAWPLVAARLHEAAGEVAPAIAELRLAEMLAPEEAGITALLGHALAGAGRGAEAEVALRAAIARCPADPDLRNRLATVLWKANRLAEMLAVLDAAIAEFGPQPTLQMNRALALNARGEQEAALAAADDAVARAQSGTGALVNRIAVLPYHPTRGTAVALLEAGGAIARRLGPPLPPLHRRGRDPGRRLRLGLLSGGLGVHPVGWLTLAGIEALPEAEFEVAAYSLKPRQDPLAARFRARCATWREMGEAEDAAIAAAIAADGVDLLLDLGGYGEGGRPFVSHHRPAPVQVKWVGAQFSTTGLPGMDWMLTDRWETPPGHQRFYTERLLRLPDGYACYAPPPYAPPVAPSPALANGHVTFGCYNNLAKVTPAVLAAWARILEALPQARLVLRTHALGEAGTRAAVRDRMAAAGLPPDRVALEGGLPHRGLLAAYGDIDIALDPFPYTGGLTVCEALWMGVPVVSLAGDSFCARHALSHLSNVGMPDWVAADADGYIALALARAGDLSALAAVRAGLRARVAASPLVDAPRFGRALGAALRHAWQDWCESGAA